MNNKLHVIQKNIHLVCIWVPTDNSARSLVCKWMDPAMIQTPVTPASQPEAGRMRLCA
jgi:hypothetical protein